MPLSAAATADRRLAGFRRHLKGYALAMVVVTAGNLLLFPNQPWFVLPLVAWGAPLALHAAWAMGLFGPSKG
jgi:hypothetical protein